MHFESVRCDSCPTVIAKEFWGADWGITQDGEDICPGCIESGAYMMCPRCEYACPASQWRGDVCDSCEDAAEPFHSKKTKEGEL